MSWGSRQERLRAGLGANSNLCFQACVCVVEDVVFSSEEAFTAAAQSRGVSIDPGGYADIPYRTDVDRLFQPSFMMNGKKKKIGRFAKTEIVLTIAPYLPSAADIDESNLLDKVVADYADAIEQAYPDLKLRGKNHAIADGLAIEFKFIVRNYDPQFCHPSDVGILKPITLFDQHGIVPKSGNIDILKSKP